MAKTFYPANNAEFLIWLANFVAVATANKAALGLTGEQLTRLAEWRAQFDQQLNDQQAKKEAAGASTTLVNTSRKYLNEEIGSLNGLFKANKSIPPDLIEAMGLHAAGEAVSSHALVAPTDLVVSGSSNGINSLKFSSGGNKDRTTYIVEAKTGDDDVYKFVAVTTKTRFDHRNQTPGVRAFYRVKAVRGDAESAYSNEAVIYN